MCYCSPEIRTPCCGKETCHLAAGIPKTSCPWCMSPKVMNPPWYLAGPMSGIAEQNYPAFRSACDQLRYAGFNVISPHETMHHPTEPDRSTWRQLLRRDAGSLLLCQGIILLPGWSTSKGAVFELHLALTLGMQIRYFVSGQLWDIS